MAQEKFERSSVVKKRTNWWRPLALVLLVYAAYSWNADPFKLEYNGYCKKDGKTRSPQELMDKFVSNIIAKQAAHGFNYIQYDSVPDFYKQNPICCVLFAWQNPKESSWGFQSTDKLFGLLVSDERYQVGISYRSKISDPKPYIGGYPIIDACAETAEEDARSSEYYEPPMTTSPFRFITGHLN